MLEQMCAGSGHQNSPGTSFDELNTQSLFQRGEGLRECRLTDVQSRRGTSEVTLLGNGDESTQL